jgi:uncharacterized protein with PIN domain
VTFIVDGMLGRLAKWLRILGFDARFTPMDDTLILAEARRDGRVLLTRDRELVRRARSHPALLLESLHWPDQVRQVLDHFDLRGQTRPFSRCLECNVPLEAMPREAAVRLVPRHVLERSPAFALCPLCGRVFWSGTHQVAMERTLRELLAAPPDRPGGAPGRFHGGRP